MNRRDDNDIENQEVSWYTYSEVETEQQQRRRDLIQLLSIIAILLIVLLMILLQVTDLADQLIAALRVTN